MGRCVVSIPLVVIGRAPRERDRQINIPRKAVCMDTSNDPKHPREPGWSVDEVMDIAAQLAAHDAVGSIHIAIDQRPTYDTLSRYRQSAADSGLTLSVEQNALALRPDSDGQVEQQAAPLTTSKARRFVQWLGALLMITNT
jgi:hypothetical protein